MGGRITPHDRERHALALLRAGCSYGEASDRTGLPLEDVISLWKGQDMADKKKPAAKPKPAPKPTYQPRSGGTGNGPPPPKK